MPERIPQVQYEGPAETSPISVKQTSCRPKRPMLHVFPGPFPTVHSSEAVWLRSGWIPDTFGLVWKQKTGGHRDQSRVGRQGPRMAVKWGWDSIFSALSLA